MIRTHQTIPIALLAHLDAGYYRGVLRGINHYSDQVRCWAFAMVGNLSDVPAMLREFRPAGVLAFRYSPALTQMLQALRVPVVMLTNTDAHQTLPMVSVDDVAVGRLAAEHFLGRGFRNLAFVGSSQYRFSNQREQGFSEAAASAGASLRSFYDVRLPSSANAWGWSGQPELNQWLGDLPRPVGILAANDALAFRVTEICRRMELRVPEDIALVGVDDDEPVCKLAHPPLSSVKQPLERIGYEGARLLDQLMSGEAPPAQPILFPPIEVVTRRSSDILAIADPDLAVALRFIHNNAHRPIGIKQVLEEVPLSRRSLERKCREALGRSPLEELLRIRLNLVKTLLSGTDLPMSGIAAQTGFRSGKQMSMTFQEQLAITPGFYRRQYRQHT